MSLGQRAAVIGGVLLALGAAAGGIVAHERAIGARDAEIKQLKATTATQAATIAKDEQALTKIDTVKVFRQVVRIDTVLQHRIDTAIVHHVDSVFVPVTVLVEAKAAIDSTKKAADACCQLARDWRGRWATTDSLYKLVLKTVPSSAKPWVDRAEGAGVCAAAVWLAGKLAKP